MTEMRKFSMAIKKHVGCFDDQVIAETLGCSKEQVSNLYDGRYFLSFDQVEKLAKLLKVTPEKLFEITDDEYNECVVTNINPFTCNENREKILDFIDIYIDAKGGVK